MGILGFGSVTKLEDLKLKDLKNERIVQEVRQDQFLVRIRRAQEQYDSMLEAASESGSNDAEIDVAAYKMSQNARFKDKAEHDLQESLTRMSVLDSAIDIINQKRELERRGVWQKINEIPEEQLEAQLEAIAMGRKQTELNLNRIVEMFDVDRQTVQSKRSADFRRSKEAILKRIRQKVG